MTPNKDIIEHINKIPEHVTDWDLCPFCMIEDDGRVGDTEKRHEEGCFRETLIEHLNSQAQNLSTAVEALEKIAKRGSTGSTIQITDAIEQYNIAKDCLHTIRNGTDGLSLFSEKHTKPPWYKSLWYFLTIKRAWNFRPKLSDNALETIEDLLHD